MDDTKYYESEVHADLKELQGYSELSSPFFYHKCKIRQKYGRKWKFLMIKVSLMKKVKHLYQRNKEYLQHKHTKYHDRWILFSQCLLNRLRQKKLISEERLLRSKPKENFFPIPQIDSSFEFSNFNESINDKSMDLYSSFVETSPNVGYIFSWRTLSYRYRRSIQRIELIHDQRHIFFLRKWRKFSLYRSFSPIISKIIPDNGENSMNNELERSLMSIGYNVNRLPVLDDIFMKLDMFYSFNYNYHIGALHFYDVYPELMYQSIFGNNSSSDSFKLVSNDELGEMIDRNAWSFFRESLIFPLFPLNDYNFNLRPVKFLDEEIDQLVDSLILKDFDLPLISNLPLEIDCEEIANEIYEDALEGLSTEATDVVYKLEQSKFFLIPKFTISDLLSNSFLSINFPFAENDVDEEALSEIFSEDLDSSFNYLSTNYIEQLRILPQRDIKVYVNDRIVEEMSLCIYLLTKMPLMNNVPSEMDISDIIYNDYNDVYDIFKPKKIDPIFFFSLKDPACFIQQSTVDLTCQNIFDELELPLIPNTPNQEDIISIISEDFDDVYSQLSLINLDRLRSYLINDPRGYINMHDLGKSIISTFYRVKIPLIPNIPNQNDIDNIVDTDFIDIYDHYSTFDISPISNLYINDIRHYLKIHDIDVLANIMFSYIDLPICINHYTQNDIDDIINHTYQDIFDIYSEIDISLALNFTMKDVNSFINMKQIEQMVKSYFEDIILPIESNTPTQIDIDQIIENDFTPQITYFSIINQSQLIRCKPCDIRKYLRASMIDEEVIDILDNVMLPLVPNVPLTEDIIEIIDDILIGDEMKDFIQLPKKLPISYITLIDIQLYVNDRIIEYLTDLILEQNPIPIEPNSYTKEDINNIIFSSYNDIFEEFSNFDTSYLMLIQPIDVQQLYANDYIVNGITTNLLKETKIPIEPNVVFNSMLSGIMEDYIDYSFSFIDFNAIKPLAEFPTPPEALEGLDDIVDRLMEKILRRDILPFMPIGPIPKINPNIVRKILEPFLLDENDNNINQITAPRVSTLYRYRPLINIFNLPSIERYSSKHHFHDFRDFD